MPKDINYRMKENWNVKVTAKRHQEVVVTEPTFKFEFQVSATYTFHRINRLAKTIVSERLGDWWKVTEVSLEMIGNDG